MTWIDRLLGRPLPTKDEHAEKVGVLTGIPLLGLDALGSASYGPEAALTILMPLGAAGIAYAMPITGAILAILGILFLSYRQTLAAYPSGGGSYTVARENLGKNAGLLAAAALLLDYTLNVAVGISAGIGALVSAFPQLHGATLALTLGVLVLVTLVNLRGVRESGAVFAVPTYLFIFTLAATLGVGVWNVIRSSGHPVPVSIPPVPLHGEVLSPMLLAWLLIRAFASGCSAMTGVEAVSNGITSFRAPSVKRAEYTLTAIVGILAAFLVGIVVVCRAYGIAATDPASHDYQSIISQITAAVWGRGWFYYLTLGSVLAVLALSANTSFSGFPSLCRIVAADGYLPHSFSIKGRRLESTVGILALSLVSGGLLVLFGGVTDRLIPLFAVGAFLAFTLSQAGMVVHWRRTGGSHWKTHLLVNLIGAIATAIALSVVVVAKFTEGAWITILLIGGVMVLFRRIKWHFLRVKRETEFFQHLQIEKIQQPIAIVPLRCWNAPTELALRLAMGMTDEVEALQVLVSKDEQVDLRDRWASLVDSPCNAARKASPKLIQVNSPYRSLYRPVLHHIRQVKARHPGRKIVVVIAELQETRWVQLFLHQQRAAFLKTALMWQGGRRVTVLSVPWYIE